MPSSSPSFLPSSSPSSEPSSSPSSLPSSEPSYSLSSLPSSSPSHFPSRPPFLTSAGRSNSRETNDGENNIGIITTLLLICGIIGGIMCLIVAARIIHTKVKRNKIDDLLSFSSESSVKLDDQEDEDEKDSKVANEIVTSGAHDAQSTSSSYESSKMGDDMFVSYYENGEVQIETTLANEMSPEAKVSSMADVHFMPCGCSSLRWCGEYTHRNQDLETRITNYALRTGLRSPDSENNGTCVRVDKKYTHKKRALEL